VEASQEQDAIRHASHGSVTEPGKWPRHGLLAVAASPQVGVPRDLAERHDHAQLAEETQFLQQKRLAAPKLEGCRLVGGRGAPRGRRDVEAMQGQPVPGG
jgi:hypothetical protein